MASNGAKATELAVNTLPLVFDDDCKVLILGTFPGRQSRKYGFYYCDQNNKFWEVMERIFKDNVPFGICQRRDYLLKHHIALWDIGACAEVKGSSDKTLRILYPNPVCSILNIMKERGRDITVFCNGKEAFELYNEYFVQKVGIKANPPLPSTSGANQWWDKKKNNKKRQYIKEWKKVAKIANA